MGAIFRYSRLRKDPEPLAATLASPVRSLPHVAIAALVALGACKRDESQGDGDKDEPAGVASVTKVGACEVSDAKGGAGNVSVTGFADPVARIILAGECPTSYGDVLGRLESADAEGCLDDGFSAVRTTLVSERAQLRGDPGGSLEECAQDPAAIYRAVLQRPCGGRPDYGLFLAVAPLATVVDVKPRMVEAIGFDGDAGLFRYYTLEEGKWHYHGDSIDMLAGPAENGARRCAACHVSGGLIMKELDTPWLHWEGRTTTPGVQGLLTDHPEMGSRNAGTVTDFRPAGKELEDAIVAGNLAWTRTRIRHQRQNDTLPRLLRPLFCDEDIGLRAASDTATPPHATGGEDGAFEIPVGGLLASSRLTGPDTLTLPLADYHAALLAAGHRVATFCDKPMNDAEGRPVVDTLFDYAYPHRAAADDAAVDLLVEEGIVDEAFVRAVLAVDLTRPFLSDARCGLLEHVPDLPAEQRKPTAIRQAVLDALAEVPDPAAVQLVENLGDSARDPTAQVSALVRACRARPTAELAKDLVAYASSLRDAVRGRPVMELPETLPTDALPDDLQRHLDPETCRIVASSPTEDSPATPDDPPAQGA